MLQELRRRISVTISGDCPLLTFICNWRFPFLYFGAEKATCLKTGAGKRCISFKEPLISTTRCSSRESPVARARALPGRNSVSSATPMKASTNFAPCAVGRTDRPAASKRPAHAWSSVTHVATMAKGALASSPAGMAPNFLVYH